MTDPRNAVKSAIEIPRTLFSASISAPDAPKMNAGFAINKTPMIPVRPLIIMTFSNFSPKTKLDKTAPIGGPSVPITVVSEIGIRVNVYMTR